MCVIEGPADLAAEAAEDLAAVGWALAEGWERTGTGPCVLTGVVTDQDDARDVVLAAVDGAGVVVHARADRALVDSLCDDLRRLGRLDHRVHEPTAPCLDAEQRELLALLANGASLGSAAARLHLSRRSADRRLAGIRTQLGVDSTGAAVAVRRARLAVLPRPLG